MSVLKITNLTKKFGDFTALDGVNLEVNKGEVYGFIGPNGAGKSTTIRVLLGILKATSGEATIFGQDVWAEAVDIHKRIRSEEHTSELQSRGQLVCRLRLEK